MLDACVHQKRFAGNVFLQLFSTVFAIINYAPILQKIKALPIAHLSGETGAMKKRKKEKFWMTANFKSIHSAHSDEFFQHLRSLFIMYVLFAFSCLIVILKEIYNSR